MKAVKELNIRQAFHLVSSILLVLFFPAMGFCQDPEEEGARYGGTLEYDDDPPGYLDPYLENSWASKDRLLSMLFEPLFRFNFIEEVYEPVLADSLSFTNEDSTRVTVFLRSGVRWADFGEGVANYFTAQDVAFTLDYLRNHARNQDLRREFTAVVDTFRVLDDHRISIRFSRRLFDPRSYLSEWVLPRHMFEQGGTDGAESPLAEEPVGSGPFRFSARNMRQLLLEANGLHWTGRRPYLNDVMVWVTQTDESSKVFRLLADQTGLLLDVKPEYHPQIVANQEHTLHRTNTSIIYTFALNKGRHPALEDRRVRFALALGSDREGMLEWFGGAGQVIAGPMAPSAQAFHEGLEPIPFDPDSANALLDQAGFLDSDGDGFREDTTTGEILAFDLLKEAEREAGETSEQQMATQFQSDMAKIGVKVDLSVEATDRYQQRLHQDHDFQIALVRWEFDPSYDIRDLFHSESRGAGGNNFVDYSNPLVDRYLERASDPRIDPGIRRENMKDVQQILRDEVPYIFCFTVDQYYAIHIKYGGVRVDPYFFFSYLREWYVDPDFAIVR